MGFPTPERVQKSHLLCLCHPVRQLSSGSSVAPTSGSDSQLEEHASRQHGQNTDHPASLPRTIQKPQAQAVSKDSQFQTSGSGPKMVDSSVQYSPRMQVLPTPSVCAHDRGLQGGMGSSLEQRPDVGNKVQITGSPPHQHIGAVGHTHRSSTATQTLETSDSPSQM